ncbi:4-hydroxyphenylacetate 3-monooxygenase, oxygenase component [Ammoniphilus sp. YIM 78166]|uniref:4-hydroxyphenylacetate 3-monooxygenase, oxygenase component n=1 Tax=Ammoniphilus sp. YIM 78166 TaxID=1644106 RepID=UPI0010701CA4|nr:4-hydroxyphenylacetate 3-monooxygenase, oxygenase component [Ammoniphilus sp. YIM 78166]
MAARTGQEYIHMITKLKPVLWFGGSKVDDPFASSTFRGLIESQAALYDIQSQPEKASFMTYLSPTSGMRVGTSFMQPKTKEDLEKRRKTTQEWGRFHAGMMGRSPDYMNTLIMALGTAAEVLSEQDPRFSSHLREYYQYCRENDLALSHTFIGPKIRVSSESERSIAARIVEENDNGLVIDGVLLMATQGGLTDEILVVSNSSASWLDLDPCTFGFAIPSDTPGLSFVCREALNYGGSTFNYPLSSRFEEMDSIVVFNRVLVPWHRVFFYGQPDVVNKLYRESQVSVHITHQVLAKNVVKTEFVLGILQLMTDTMNLGHRPDIQEKVGEVIVALETLRGLLFSSELQAATDRWGSMLPDYRPLLAARQYFPKLYPRMMEIMQWIGSSALMTIPSEETFQSPIGEDLIHFLKTNNQDGYERTKLYRLAWELCMSSFGTRQVLYERFFFGDPLRKAEELYRSYDRSDCIAWVRQFLDAQGKQG